MSFVTIINANWTPAQVVKHSIASDDIDTFSVRHSISLVLSLAEAESLSEKPLKIQNR
jgi:hypothetical protein